MSLSFLKLYLVMISIVIKDVSNCPSLYLLNLWYLMFFFITGADYPVFGDRINKCCVRKFFFTLRVQFFKFLRKNPNVLFSLYVNLSKCDP